MLTERSPFVNGNLDGGATEKCQSPINNHVAHTFKSGTKVEKVEKIEKIANSKSKSNRVEGMAKEDDYKHIVAKEEDIDEEEHEEEEEEVENQDGEVDTKWSSMDHIIWPNVFWYGALHVALLAALCKIARGEVGWRTLSWAFLLYLLGFIGITAGVHRLWSHRAYRARLPLRIFLAALNSLAAQNSIYVWSRDHRVHHRHTETDADPHNINRGFFFAHIGWLLSRKHPRVAAYGRKIDCSDLWRDPVVRLQYRYYYQSVLLCNFVIPTLVPTLLWAENLWIAFLICAPARYIISLHATWLVNSAAHVWGYRPYDSSIAPAENVAVSALTSGEGFHNYHHVFPYDYATSELGWRFNLSTAFIDIMAAIGLVYDRRSASAELIARRKARTGEKDGRKNQ